MADKRSRLNGYQYRKKAQEKGEKERTLLEQTARIDTFFNESVPERPSNSCGAFLAYVPELYKAISGERGDGIDEVNDSQVNGGVSEESEGVYEVTLPIPPSSSSCSFKCDKDPAKWIVDDELRDFIAQNGYCQNANSDFKTSKRTYKDQTRYFSSALFERKLQNGEVSNRQWIIFSESIAVIDCVPCRLFSDANTCFGANQGFNDWKNEKACIEQDELSVSHKEAPMVLRARDPQKGLKVLLDSELAQERRYWRDVLERVVVIVRKSTSRGLALKGSDEILGSSHNGNLLMCLEMLAEFDSFTREHIRRFGRPGNGRTNYLSSTTYQEVVHIMAQKCRGSIVPDLKAAKYYSIIVDSTPDIAHFDQLAIVVRYVRENGTSTEVFLTFLPNCGAQELYTAVTEFLVSVGIDLKDCRGAIIR